MSNFVYILKCSDNTFYTGVTNNLERRLFEHNNSDKGAKYTHGRRPVKMIFSEQHATLISAMRREVEIKKWKREKRLALVMKNSG